MYGMYMHMHGVCLQYEDYIILASFLSSIMILKSGLLVASLKTEHIRPNEYIAFANRYMRLYFGQVNHKRIAAFRCLKDLKQLCQGAKYGVPVFGASPQHSFLPAEYESNVIIFPSYSNHQCLIFL